MTIDRYTKLVLTVITLGILLNGLNPWIASTKAYAQLSNSDLSSIESDLSILNSNVSAIYNGLCLNSKIC